MATYKTANNLPILEEVTETTYALVEDGGTLKRVPGSSLGGGAGNFCVITEHMENTNGENSTYTCNMTYEELKGAIENRTLSGLNVICYYAFFMGVYLIMEVRIEDSIIKITCNFPHNLNYSPRTICFNPDNTITN